VEVGLVTEIMNVFVEAFSGGFDRIRGAVSSLLYLLIAIEVGWFGILFLLGTESVSGGLKKLLTIGMWSFVALHFDEHALALVDSLVQAGLMAANSGGQSARSLLNPSAIMDAGFTAVHPLGQQLLNGSLLSFTGTYPMYLLTFVLMMIAYTALAINAFMVLIEYYLAIAVVGILVPFGVIAPTRWIAMKPMSYFLSCGLKMMVIAFLVAVSRTVLARIHFASDEPTLREMWIAVCCTSMIGLLCWKAPDRLAQGFMVGSASFGGADAVRHTQSTAAVVAAPAAMALGGVRNAVAKAVYQKLHGPPSGASGGGSGSRSSNAAALSLSASRSPSAAAQPPVLVPPPSDNSERKAG
jgi:type IV secretion system protein TrbL